MSAIRCVAWVGAFLVVAAAAPAQRRYFQVGDEVPVTGKAVAGFEHVDAYFTALLRDHDLPGASVAIAKDGRLVYARGFGWADAEAKEPVEPTTRFRIASVSKPITSVAVMRLVEQGKLSLDDRAFELLDEQGPGAGQETEGDAGRDPRLDEITIDELLRHRGGFDRDASGDPMFMCRRIAREMGVESPPDAPTIVRWLQQRPLDFDPGSRMAYSNAGYAVLGLVIERASGQSYASYVRREVLAPLGITAMRPGRSRIEDRAPGEARYETRGRTGPSVFGTQGKQVDAAYGTFAIEPMIAHGGWLASSVDLVRFASAIGTKDFRAVLSDESVERMFAGPEDEGNGNAYYAHGWSVRDWKGRGRNTWHTGSLPGTSTLLVRRWDGVSWAVLFDTREGIGLEGEPASVVDGAMHGLVDRVRRWPEDDRFQALLGSEAGASGR